MADLKARSRDWIALYNAHDLDALVATFMTDAEVIGPGAPPARGHTAIRELYKLQFAAFPDGKLTMDTLVAEGNTVAGEYTFSGTNTGPLTLPTGQTLPATNKRVSSRGASVVTGDGDKVQSLHVYFDQAETLMQLGLMPAPAATTA